MKFVLLSFIISILTTNALAFNTVNQTGMWVSVEGDRGSYKETIPPNSTSSGWRMGSETNYTTIQLTAAWGFKRGDGAIQLIGGRATCTATASGQQYVTGSCTPVTVGGYWQCKGPQQTPQVSCY